ncbi:RICIN domain-containing protein [Mycoplasmatota bacterium]|nr:RICIN domain-containing protein [Mycoplasmatota bacterium]
MNKICKLFLLMITFCLLSFSLISVNAKNKNYFEDVIYFDNFTESNIEEYDLYHLLSYDEANVFVKWLEDSYKLKLDKDYDLISNNLSKFVLLAMQKGIVKNYYAEYTVLWWGSEHEGITSQGINILQNDGKTNAYNFFSQYISVLEEYSKKPDLDESIGGTHYYVYEGTPSTYGEYYKNNNGNYSRSARTRFEDHYSSAMNCYKNGKHTLAMQYLGRALHYIEDIGTTPHSYGIGYNYDPILVWLNPHKKYESWVNDNYNSYSEFKAHSSSKYDYVLDSSFQNIANDLARISSSYKNNVDNCGVYECYISGYYDAALNTLPLTQEIVAGILNRFYEEVTNNSSINYIKDGTTYFIKNYKSTYYLDVENSGTSDGTNIQQNSYQGGLNQQFTVVMNSDGTFSFRPKNAPTKALTINNGNLELITYDSTDINQKFKFTYIKYGYYRIMTGSSGFARVLGVGSPYTDVGNDIEEYIYNPDNLDQQWYFEEHAGHIYRIILRNLYYHNTLCDICGEYFAESHEWHYNGSYYICLKCGMVSDGPVPVTQSIVLNEKLFY